MGSHLVKINYYKIYFQVCELIYSELIIQEVHIYHGICSIFSYIM
jgi:hypothetical protein